MHRLPPTPSPNGNIPPILGLMAIQPARPDTFLASLSTVLEQHFSDEGFGACELSRALFLCPMQVHRKVKQRTGFSPGHLLLRFRLLKAQEMLRSTDLSIGEIAWRAGFASQNYFARAYHKEMGLTPREERKQERL